MAGSKFSQDEAAPWRRKIFYAASALSVLLSLAMLGVAVFALSFAIGPLIVANFLAFITSTLLAGNVSILRKPVSLSRRDHNIWRLIILTFAACGIGAVVLGVRIA